MPCELIYAPLLRLESSFLRASDDHEPAGTVGNSALSSGAKKTVMICEDDPDLLRVYRLALRSKYDIVTANSGAECLRKYAEIKETGGKVDALLLDFRLGDTTGDDVAAKIRELDGTKVVLISAFDVDELLVSGLIARDYITQFVRKPITMQQLAAIIDLALRQ
jgi:DNA-binding response OmpR family regulator